MVVDDTDDILGILRLLLTVSEVGQLSVIVGIMEGVLAVQANILVLRNNKPTVDQCLLLVGKLRHSSLLLIAFKF